MKRLMSGSAALLAALILAVAPPAHAQEESILLSRTWEQPNLLLVNPGDLINGVISVEYERALATFFGLAFGLSVSTFRGVFTPSSSASYVAVGPEVSARFHFIQDAPAGLWIGPSINAGYVASSSNGAVNRAIVWGLGAAVGYNFILFRHFALQLGVGGGFNDYGEGLTWYPRFRLGIGGAF